MSGKSYPDSGDMLYGDIIQKIKQGESIEIDLSGVLSLPSMFLNASFGRIARELGVQTMKSKITFFNISKAQAERLGDYFKNLS